jgi:hypothetical protein
MGYGFQVKALINGLDIGMKGGQSESKRFMGVDHPMKQEAAPEMAAKYFILKPGENTLHLEFTKVGVPTDKLSLDITKGEETEPFVKFESTDASGVVDKTFTL